MKKEKKKRSHQVYETNAKLSEGKERYEEMKGRSEGKELPSILVH